MTRNIIKYAGAVALVFIILAIANAVSADGMAECEAIHSHATCNHMLKR